MSNKKFETKKINDIKIKPFNKNYASQRTIIEPLPDPISQGIGKAYILYINSKIGSGKSILISNLLNIYKCYFKRVYFCSSNIEEDEEGEKEIKDHAYKDLFKFSQERLYDNFNDNIMEKILNDISDCKKEDDFNIAEDYFLLIVDDLSTAFIKINSLITKTMLRIRHLNLCVWIISQRYKNINPSIRNQLNYFVTFKTQNKKEIESMAETIGYDSKNFNILLDFATNEPYSFLFIDSSKNPPKFYKNLNEEIII